MAVNWDYVDRGGDLLGGLGGLAGSLLGDAGAENARREARGTLAAWRGLYQGINPIVSAVKEEEVGLGPSAMEGVASEVDPSSRAAQVSALRSLMGIANEGGMDPQSRAALLQAQGAAARERAATTGALRQSFQSRGMGGGGMELALATGAGQQAANANAMAGVQAAADARTRQLQALSQGAGLAGQVRGQDYSQAADRAGARDRVAEYNARNQQAVRGRNADRAYTAQQQTVDNRFRSAAGQAGAMAGQVDEASREAERRARQGYAIGGAAGSLLGSVGGGLLGGW